MIGICNGDMRLNLLYQQLKHHTECILIDDGQGVNIDLDYLILPLSGINDQHIMMMRGIEMKVGDHFFDMVKPEGLVICGNVNEALLSYHKNVFDINNIESFKQGNSQMSAEGVLYLLIDHTRKGLYDLKVDIIGYGSVGKALYGLLRCLGVKTRVIRRHLEEDKENFITVEDYQRKMPYEVIINTSLTAVVDEAMIQKMDDHLIINLVSSFKINEALLRNRHSRIIHAGPLPALLSPVSAAKLMADTLQEIFHD